MIVILGCGPAGLLAAHACQQADREFIIYSKKQKSVIGGAQYLHAGIPGLSEDVPNGTLTYVYNGTAEGYARKVYGDPKARTSWMKFGPHEKYVDMKAAYDLLWRRFESEIIDCDINPWLVDELVCDNEAVFSSIPLHVLCTTPGAFEWQYQDVWIENGGDYGVPADSIFYNGRTGPGEETWYRASNIGGFESLEYSHDPGGVTNAFKIRKPLSTTADPFPGKVHRIGRYGKWEKEELAHQAYFETLEVLSAL